MNQESKVTVFMTLIVLLLVTIGVFMISNRNSSNPDEYVYNDFRIFKNPTVGFTVVAYLDAQPYHLQLRNDPKSTENITIDPKIRPLILDKEEVFFTINPNSNSIPVLGATEMANILGTRLGIFNKNVYGAVTHEANISKGNIVADCNDVTQKVNIVRLQLGDETEVYIENDCIIVQGTDEWEIVRASDRFIYHVLQVIED